MSWRSLSTIFPWNKSRGNEAKAQLARAYKAVFSGRASQEQAEVVLSDLANVTGFYRCHPAGTSAEVLQYSEGMRFVFGHIHSFVNLSPEDLNALEQAARREAVVDEQFMS